MPKNNWELQRSLHYNQNTMIIPCQKITGNYNVYHVYTYFFLIIPCQKITGNYYEESYYVLNTVQFTLAIQHPKRMNISIIYYYEIITLSPAGLVKE